MPLNQTKPNSVSCIAKSLVQWKRQTCDIKDKLKELTDKHGQWSWEQMKNLVLNELQQ